MVRALAEVVVAAAAAAAVAGPLDLVGVPLDS